MQMNMKTVGSLALGLLAGIVGQPHAARAALYDFTYTSGSNRDASGIFDVTATQIVGISGTVDGFGTITGLYQPGFFLVNDNQFSPLSPFLTGNGVSFTTSSGTGFNLFYDTSDYGLATFGSNDFGSFVASSQTVPEPATFALLAGGLLGLAGARRPRIRL
jgi:hypothetical protein